MFKLIARGLQDCIFYSFCLQKLALSKEKVTTSSTPHTRADVVLRSLQEFSATKGYKKQWTVKTSQLWFTAEGIQQLEIMSYQGQWEITGCRDDFLEMLFQLGKRNLTTAFFCHLKHAEADFYIFTNFWFQMSHSERKCMLCSAAWTIVQHKRAFCKVSTIYVTSALTSEGDGELVVLRTEHQLNSCKHPNCFPLQRKIVSFQIIYRIFTVTCWHQRIHSAVHLFFQCIPYRFT